MELTSYEIKYAIFCTSIVGIMFFYLLFLAADNLKKAVIQFAYYVGTMSFLVILYFHLRQYELFSDYED